MFPLARTLDPRYSLAAAIGWLVLLLSIAVALAAGLWVDGIVRASLLTQRSLQLERTGERLAARLDLNLGERLQKVRVLAATLSNDLPRQAPAAIRATLENVQQASPEFDWIAVATPQGYGLAGTQGTAEGGNVAGLRWFSLALRGLPPGDVELLLDPEARGGPGATRGKVSLTTPVIDRTGDTIGVIGAQLGRRWWQELAQGLLQELGDSEGTGVLILDADGAVLLDSTRDAGGDRRALAWPRGRAAEPEPGPAGFTPSGSRVREIDLADGTRWLVSQVLEGPSSHFRALGWQVLAVQPLEDATAPARALQRQIAAILSGLGLCAALAGLAIARHLTRDLEAIAQSADAVRLGTSERIAVPAGRNEAARVGSALEALLVSLHRERSALQALNTELDQRVAARTRDIERLSEQARYAALARQRLTIARDLHDTLAHSMMAMLTEIRLLKRLHATQPASLPEELARAEETAHQGLQEARAAIAQLRFSPVRDAGLAAAVEEHLKLFAARTAIAADFVHTLPAGSVADERGEILFRMAEEVLRNIERHAGAREVEVRLRAAQGDGSVVLTISDDGIGFDPDLERPGHFGLTGLREQAALIGAQLEITSAPGAGTRVTVTLPSSP